MAEQNSLRSRIARTSQSEPTPQEGQPSRILIQVRNKGDRQYLQDWLSDLYEIISVDGEPPLLERFDLAILDGPTLKRFASRFKTRRKQEEPVFLPFLLLAARRKGSRPARHLGRLVDGLILRPLNQDELQARGPNLLRRRRLSLDLKKEHDRVVKLSVTDDVSGFYNTRYLHRYLDRALASPNAREEQVSLVFFDLDNFKDVVDTHGHILGAKVLREVAQAVARVLDPDDRLVRYGGDEYVVILPRQDKEQAVSKVDHMKHVLTTTPFLQKEGLDVFLTASFGLATFPYDAADKRELLGEADRCLFKSKSRGKNRISFAGMERRAETLEPVLDSL